MAARSKVQQLPDEVRQALEQRLIAGGFSDYVGLAEWLAEQGFEISKSSLHRWGSDFEDRVKALQLATHQARALAEAAPDDEGKVNDALIRMAQEQLTRMLIGMRDEPSKGDLSKLTKSIADLARASVTQKRYAAEARKAARAELLAEQAERLEHVAAEQGMSADQLQFWREQFLGVR
ncbi:MAG: DUF3486 family protein [Pseudomonadota bacterium]|nr:DUF3486 family protein [Pseudomonadota bacterium]